MGYREASSLLCVVFFFNDTATTEIYTLSLHDALPICRRSCARGHRRCGTHRRHCRNTRSEEHTSELQSLFGISYAVFCLKKNNSTPVTHASASPRIARRSPLPCRGP